MSPCQGDAGATPRHPNEHVTANREDCLANGGAGDARPDPSPNVAIHRRHPGVQPLFCSNLDCARQLHGADALDARASVRRSQGFPDLVQRGPVQAGCGRPALKSFGAVQKGRPPTTLDAGNGPAFPPSWPGCSAPRVAAPPVRSGIVTPSSAAARSRWADTCPCPKKHCADSARPNDSTRTLVEGNKR
jgi:hypothetical protein